MKIFQSPWVAGGLAAVAVAVVFYVVFLPRLWPARRTQTQQSTALAMTNAPKGTASVVAPPPRTVPPPPMAIDRSYAQTRFAGWIAAPPRDPFLIVSAFAAAPAKAPLEISPVAMMKLKGIWRQTGGNLAAIDKGVYSEGDQIVAGYKLDRIDSEQVWIQGPEKKERLDFDKRFSAVIVPPGTNFIERFLGPEQADPLRPRL